MALSQRQKDILRFLRDFAEYRGYPPTVREIGAAVGISSTSVVNYNLKRLEEKGHLVRNPDVSRGIKMLGTDARLRSGGFAVPLLGRIAAGAPLHLPDVPDPEVADTIALSSDIIDSDESTYALEVRGYSMVDALVSDGDIVIVRKAESIESGEMAVVWLREEGETTLKRVFWEGEEARLQPANPYMQAWRVPAANVEIQGKVIAVIRRPVRPGG
jgi:repressor LexA